jgi:hypothetical protein
MTILAAVGDIARFPTSKQLVGYAGLGTRIHASWQVQSSRGITKEGRSEPRIAMVSRCLGGCRTSSPKDQGNLSERAVRIGKPKAIVAIARKRYGGRLARAQSTVCRYPRVPCRAVARSLHSFPARCGTRCRQTPLSGSALASRPGSVGAWRRSGSNSLQRSPLSPQRRAPGKRKDLRSVLVSFLSGCFSLSRQEPYGLLRFATQVLTRLSMRCLQLLGLIQSQERGWFCVLLTCCPHRCQETSSHMRL